MATPPSIELLLRQAGRGVGQINARAGARASALSGFAPRVAGYYENLGQQQQALGGALGASLTGAGAQMGADISGALQGIQAPQQAVSQYGGGTAAMGAAAGAATGALSSADLQRLRATGTAEQIYAAALPRLAMLAGEQERRSFLADAQQQLADLSLEEAQRRQEDAMENARYEREWRYKVQQDRISRRREDREFRYEARQDRLDRRRQAGLDRLAQQAAAQEYGLDLRKEQRYAASDAETARHHRATEALAIRRANESDAQFRARERRYQQQFRARLRAAARQGKQPDASLSAKYGYMVDSYGNPILTKNGKRIPIASDSGGKAPWDTN